MTILIKRGQSQRLWPTNSQESLEIIIYIQTASHKIFSMWWRGFGWYQNLLSHALKKLCAFLPVFVRFGRFARSCPFCTLPRAPLKTTNSQESLEIIIYIQTASHKNFSMWWRGFGWYQNLLSHALKNFCAFLPVFAQFGRFGRSCPFCTLPRAPLERKTARKVWKL